MSLDMELVDFEPL